MSQGSGESFKEELPSPLLPLPASPSEKAVLESGQKQPEGVRGAFQQLAPALRYNATYPR